MFVVLAVPLALAGCDNPFKVTEPSDPEFDVTKFDFNDYDNHKELINVLRKLFKPGDSREKIEKILVDAVGAGAQNVTHIKTFGKIRDQLIAEKRLLKKSDRVVSYQKKMYGTYVPNV